MSLVNTVRIVHVSFASCGFALNGLLLSAIALATPRSFASYAFILLCNALCDVLANFLEVFVMQRLIVVHQSIIYISSGICSLISPQACFIGQSGNLHALQQSLALICIAFWYRYIILQRFPPTRRRLATIILLAYLPSCVQMVGYALSQDDESELRTVLAQFYPEAARDDSLTVSGVLDVVRPMPAYTFAMGGVVPFFIYIVILVLRTKTLGILARHSCQMSEGTRKKHYSLITALTLHAALPAVSLCASASFLLMSLDILHHPIMESAVFVFASLTPSFSPLLTLYFIGPYRRYALRLLSPSARAAIEPTRTQSLSDRDTGRF